MSKTFDQMRNQSYVISKMQNNERVHEDDLLRAAHMEAVVALGSLTLEQLEMVKDFAIKLADEESNG